MDNLYNVLVFPVIIFISWFDALQRYKKNKEEKSKSRYEVLILLFWLACAIASIICYIFTTDMMCIFIAIYALIFLILRVGNWFKVK